MTWLTSNSVRLKNYEGPLAVASQCDQHGSVRIQLADDSLKLIDISDRLPIDLLDHVARSELLCRSRIRINTGNDHAVYIRRNVGLSPEPLCKILHFDSGKDRALRTAVLIGHVLAAVKARDDICRLFNYCCSNSFGLPIPHEIDCQTRADIGFCDPVDQRNCIFDLITVDLANNVATDDACF